MKQMIPSLLFLFILFGCVNRDELSRIPIGIYKAEVGDEYLQVLPGNKIFFHLKNNPDNGKYLDRTHLCHIERNDYKKGDYIRPEGVVSSDIIHGVLQYEFEWSNGTIIVWDRFRTEKRVFTLSP